MTLNSLPVLDPADTRLNAARDDLAHSDLKGKVVATKFVDPVPGAIKVSVADLKSKPVDTNNNIHQLLFGEAIHIFDQQDGWAWVQSRRDRYVGYVRISDIQKGADLPFPTHSVRVARTFVYPKAELRNPPQMMLSMASQVVVIDTREVRGTKYAMLNSGGFVVQSHLRPIDDHAKDFVVEAERLLHTPYLWGGASAFGLDCSALVQLSMRMCGHEELRDSDMQAGTLGKEIDAGENMRELQRGDLIFWPGHVAIHKGSIHGIPHIIHASGHTMSVAIEPLHPALERIAYLYQKPIGFRRPW